MSGIYIVADEKYQNIKKLDKQKQDLIIFSLPSTDRSNPSTRAIL